MNLCVVPVVLLCATGYAQTNAVTTTSQRLTNAAVTVSTNQPSLADAHLSAEQVRAACLKGRRTICGQVVQVLPEGLVVDSGYTSLLRPPLTQSWVVPRTVSATRDTNAIESAEPGSTCIGLIFLTDVPKTPVAKQYDYVIIHGYPAGEYAYTSVPGVTRTIRKFAAGLETAIRLKSEAR